MTIHVGDKVLYHGECYEVTRKYTGVDMYEIGRKHRQNGQQFLTHIKDGLRAEDLTLVKEGV